MRMRWGLLVCAILAAGMLGTGPSLGQGYGISPFPGIPAPLIDPPRDPNMSARPPPPRPGPGHLDRPWAPPPRPVVRIICDPWGRCWREYSRFPSASYGNGYDRRPYDRDPYARNGFNDVPPPWADELPARLQDPDRFARPRPGVVCDLGTRLCYKHGQLDKSETADAFGPRAAALADDIRDARGTDRVFVPEPGVTCDAARQVCYDGRFKDPRLTRRYFGRDAGGSLLD